MNLIFILVILIISVTSLKIASKVFIYILIVLVSLVISLKTTSKIHMLLSLYRF